MTEKQKLAAILAADVVGFSRLTGSDEEGTLARLRQTSYHVAFMACVRVLSRRLACTRFG
jgi:class 3 adenylate cyclase